MTITAEITRLDAMTMSREIIDSIRSSTIIKSLQIENVILDYIKRHKKIDLTGLNNKDLDEPDSWMCCGGIKLDLDENCSICSESCE